MMERLTALISKPVAWFTGEHPAFVHGALLTAVYFLSKGYSVRNIRALVQQMAHETAWGTSYSVETDNNLWGMNCVSLRETSQNGCRETNSGEVLGTYSSLWHSVRDRYLWDDYWGYTDYRKSSNYMETISERYHASPNYSGAVLSVSETRVNRVLTGILFVVPLEGIALVKFLKLLK